jgi:hypothetical protein
VIQPSGNPIQPPGREAPRHDRREREDEDQREIEDEQGGLDRFGRSRSAASGPDGVGPESVDTPPLKDVILRRLVTTPDSRPRMLVPRLFAAARAGAAGVRDRPAGGRRTIRWRPARPPGPTT